jgi:hypothetical protein
MLSSILILLAAKVIQSLDRLVSALFFKVPFHVELYNQENDIIKQLCSLTAAASDPKMNNGKTKT